MHRLADGQIPYLGLMMIAQTRHVGIWATITPGPMSGPIM